MHLFLWQSITASDCGAVRLNSSICLYDNDCSGSLGEGSSLVQAHNFRALVCQPSMFVHVMDPSSQVLTLQATTWWSKDLKHCKGALGATRPSVGTNATTYTLSVHYDNFK